MCSTNSWYLRKSTIHGIFVIVTNFTIVVRECCLLLNTTRILSKWYTYFFIKRLISFRTNRQIIYKQGFQFIIDKQSFWTAVAFPCTLESGEILVAVSIWYIQKIPLDHHCRALILGSIFYNVWFLLLGPFHLQQIYHSKVMFLTSEIQIDNPSFPYHLSLIVPDLCVYRFHKKVQSQSYICTFGGIEHSGD